MPESFRSPKGRRGAATRDKLIATAALVFAQRGFAATTMEEVARVADVAKGTTYQYFHTKEELYAAALESLISEWGVFESRWRTQLQGADVSTEASARGLIQEFLQDLFQFLQSRRALLRLVWVTEEVSQSTQQLVHRVLSSVQGVFALLQSTVKMNPDVFLSRSACLLCLQSFYQALYLSSHSGSDSQTDTNLNDLAWSVWALLSFKKPV